MQYKKLVTAAMILWLAISINVAKAQTEWDAIMMNKTQFCNGFMYNQSSWKNYWEGTLKRENLNIGKISTQSLMYMANYGVTDNLNIMAGLPYVWTKASAGTLSGMKGVQDLSIFAKWRVIHQNFAKGKASVFLIGGVSTPLSDYVIDYLPLSIGLGSTNITGRVMADYQWKKISVTGSVAYVRRSNVKLDRNSYFDTQVRLSNEVEMPDMAQFQLRAGYRGKYLIAEATLTNMTTQGGFDITRNNMPFPSNRMNATQAGLWLKYTLPVHTNLSVLGSVNYTVAGRNMGQATAFGAGIFYAFYFGKQNKK